jgi:hypothetical protein
MGYGRAVSRLDGAPSSALRPSGHLFGDHAVVTLSSTMIGANARILVLKDISRLPLSRPVHRALVATALAGVVP